MEQMECAMTWSSEKKVLLTDSNKKLNKKSKVVD